MNNNEPNYIVVTSENDMVNQCEYVYGFIVESEILSILPIPEFYSTWFTEGPVVVVFIW
jgi:hypothetical protein